MIGDMMPEDKKDEICGICNKYVDLEKDDFIIGVSPYGDKILNHFSCIERKEKEMAREIIIGAFENNSDW